MCLSAVLRHAIAGRGETIVDCRIGHTESDIIDGLPEVFEDAILRTEIQNSSRLERNYLQSIMWVEDECWLQCQTGRISGNKPYSTFRRCSGLRFLPTIAQCGACPVWLKAPASPSVFPCLPPAPLQGGALPHNSHAEYPNHS